MDIPVLNIMEDSASIVLNAKMYPAEIVYSTSYAFVDKAFIVLDGDPSDKIIVNLQRKQASEDMKKIVDSYLCELLNYLVVYAHRSENRDIRRILLERALNTNG